MSVIVAPSRMEPVHIEDPSADLIARVDRLLISAQRLETLVLSDFKAALVRATDVASGWHSNLLERRSCIAQELCNSATGESIARNAVVAECLGLAALHRAINKGFCRGDLPDPSTSDWICTLHAAFGAYAPAIATLAAPGLYRNVDVEVGDHLPPPHERLEDFMAHFSARFRLDRMPGRVTRVLAVASSHHRLSWIHPFVDGNGRLVRLYSHAMGHHAGIAAGGLWSLPRALAAGRSGAGEYHAMMAFADRSRQGDRDGRGNLSLAALEGGFVTWFLDSCLSEIERAGTEISSLSPADLGRLDTPSEWPMILPELYTAP